MLDMEIGKLMARLDAVQQNIQEMKTQIDLLRRQVAVLPADLQKETEKRFMTRLELMPIKNALSMMVLTTLSAICMGLVQVFFNLF